MMRSGYPPLDPLAGADGRPERQAFPGPTNHPNEDPRWPDQRSMGLRLLAAAGLHAGLVEQFRAVLDEYRDHLPMAALRPSEHRRPQLHWWRRARPAVSQPHGAALTHPGGDRRNTPVDLRGRRGGPSSGAAVAKLGTRGPGGDRPGGISPQSGHHPVRSVTSSLSFDRCLAAPITANLDVSMLQGGRINLAALRADG